MKYLLLLMAVICFLSLKAQQNFVEIAMNVAKSEGGSVLGGQVQFEHEAKSCASLGLGVQMLWFKDMRGPYIPLYGLIGYNFHASKTSIGLHANVGYGFYNNSDSYTTTEGGLYFASGIAFRAINKTSPFIDIRYSLYKFSGNGMRPEAYVSNVNAITFAFGIAIADNKHKAKPPQE